MGGVLLILVLVVLHASPVLADTFPEITGSNNLWSFLQKLLQAVVIIFFPIIVLMVVFTGFLFVTAQGNEQKLSQAKQALVWTFVGALVILGAQALSFAVKATVDDIKAGTFV